MKHIYKKGIVVFLAALFLSACSSEFLEVKPQKGQVIVETLKDIEALLDNVGVMNKTDPYHLISDGDFYYTDSKVAGLPDIQRNLYLWKSIIDPTGRSNSAWDMPYQQIMYANIAMETLEQMHDYEGNKRLWEELYGRALFFRAWAHYHLLQDFAEGFDPEQQVQLGVPFIKDSTFPKEVERSSLTEVYRFIVDDLNRAEDMLPMRSDIRTRPSQQAAYALLSRVYLNQQEYHSALEHADKALNIDDRLLDYNDLTNTGTLPFSTFTFNTHPEIIFFTSSTLPLVGTAGVEGESSLLSAYEIGDLRSYVYFNEERLYTGTYSGDAQYQFTGLGIDELYLTKAECLLFLGEESGALEVMNELLARRFENGVFDRERYEELTKDELLTIVWTERRKELVGRATRWTDLKRLNVIGKSSTNLSRIYEGEQYSLPANDHRYLFEIPKIEIETYGLEQNIR